MYCFKELGCGFWDFTKRDLWFLKTALRIGGFSGGGYLKVEGEGVFVAGRQSLKSVWRDLCEFTRFF